MHSLAISWADLWPELKCHILWPGCQGCPVHPWSLAIENFRLVQTNLMFWMKLASRADEAPTFETGFVGHGLRCQKKVSKTQCCSTLFFSWWKWKWPTCTRGGPINANMCVFLNKTPCFSPKCLKTARFWPLFGSCLLLATSLITACGRKKYAVPRNF